MNLSEQDRGWDKSFRLAFIQMALLLSFFVFLGTEILSYFRALSFWPVLIYWLVVGGGLWIFKPVPIHPFHIRAFHSFTLIEKILIVITVLMVGFLGFVALWAPPNNFDSMTYHMARIPHWIHNASVAFYPTNILRQLFSGPMAEYWILHLFILTGSDILANSVQWVAMGGCVLAGSLLARMLGADRKGQLLTGFLIATIPMGIVQSTSTQNDYVVSFYFMSFALFMILYAKLFKFYHLILAGLALGMGVLTKGTMVILGTVLLIGFLATGFKNNFGKKIKFVLCVFILALSINVPHYVRNYQLSGNIFAPQKYSKSVVNQRFSPDAIFAQIIRNLGSHLQMPVQEWNEAIEKFIYSIHDSLDITLNHDQTTFGEPFKIQRSYDEDSTGNMRHMLLFIMVAGLIVVRRRMPNRRVYLGYTLVCIGAFIALAIYIKWQPWISRFHLPVFVFSAPLLGTVIAKIDRKGLGLLLIIIFTGCSMTWLTKNPKKRIISSKKLTLFNTHRTERYFITERDVYDDMQEVVDYVSSTGCSTIGLDLGADSWEYPWWVLLKQKNQGARLVHVNVRNNSIKFLDPTIVACVVILEGKRGDYIIIDQGGFDLIFRNERYSLYQRSP